jgi:hypothetical protein
MKLLKLFTIVIILTWLNGCISFDSHGDGPPGPKGEAGDTKVIVIDPNKGVAGDTKVIIVDPDKDD